jgi:4-alpha-glucanotransferase
MGADGATRNLQQLETAAVACGIELEYTDTWGRTHHASEQTLRAILAAFGERPPEGLPPTMVVFEDEPSLVLPVAPEHTGGTLKLEFEWENGELEHHWFFVPELANEDKGKRVPLPKLRLGYHRLRIHLVAEPQLTTLGDLRFIVCPRKAQTLDQRVAGVALSLYGLRSERNWGIGDTTDLKAITTTLAAAGAHFVALNPLHALPNRQPYNISPYLPECTLYRNFLYLDVEHVPGYQPSDVDWAEVEALRASEFVEYERVAAVKLKALRVAFARFLAADTTDELDRYAAGEGAFLHDYATYSALWNYQHEKDSEVWLWTDWSKGYRDPRSGTVRGFANKNEVEILFYQFLQWQLDRQFCEAQDHASACGMKIGLYHDLALATDKFGADLWANGPFFALGARVGAPPDELAPGGQDWGFPPPNRDVHRANGYELFAQSIRKNARHGGALRIDHVMRFFRLFWIPDALTAADGAYVRDYAEDLLRILCLESARGGFIVIGEDLGTVPPGTRERLGEAGILGYRVLWFEQFGGRMRLPQEYPEFAAVSTTTHDLPTLAGFFTGRDIEARRAAGLVDESGYQHQWESRKLDIVRAETAFAEAGFPHDALSFVLAAPSMVAIINQEDLTGETEQQNLPASTRQHPNWRRKMRVTVDEFAPLAAELRGKIERSGRL